MQGYRSRHSPQWQHRPGPHHGPMWHHWLLTSGKSSLPMSLQVCLSLLCLHSSVSLSHLFLYYLLVPISGTQGLSVWDHLRSDLRRTMPCLCHKGTGRGHPRHGLPHRPGGHLRLASVWVPCCQYGGHQVFTPCLAYLSGPMRQLSLSAPNPAQPSPAHGHRCDSSCLWLTPYPGSSFRPMWC